MAGAQRPTVATVFAIINIVFGGFSCIGGLIGIAIVIGLIAAGQIFAAILLILGILVGVLLLLSGIFLLMNKKNALQITLYYVIGSLVVTVISIIFTIAITKTGLGAMNILNLVYPALVFVLVLRNEAVKKFYA